MNETRRIGVDIEDVGYGDALAIAGLKVFDDGVQRVLNNPVGGLLAGGLVASSS